MERALSKALQRQIETLKILVVDDEPNMRKVVRTMLLAMGIKTVYEAADGMAGLDAIRKHMPHLVIVDWEMPLIDGAQFVRMVRQPMEFPAPDIPIIMLSGHGDRWRVVEAARLGAHEYLLKPVSTTALLERIVTILTIPRPFMSLDGYYGPAPRKMFANTRPVDKEAWQADLRPAKPVPTRQVQAQAQSRVPSGVQPRAQSSARHGAQPAPDTAGSGNADDVVLL
jgi:two-component system chemotaxis response regulator CheY